MHHTVNEKVLDNGLKILYIDIPGVKSFDLAIAINAGYRFSTKENIEQYEIPHVLEHLVFDGSVNYPTSDELQAVFSAGGGDSNGFTTPYHNVFAFHNRVRNAEQVLRAGLDMVFHPLLSDKAFDEEVKVIENEITGNMGDFAGNAMLYTAQQILPDFPGSSDTQLARLPDVTFKSIAPYHKKYYCTANTTVMIAADFNEIKKAQIEKLIYAATADIKRGHSYKFPTFKVAAANPSAAEFVSVHKSMQDTIAYAMFTHKGKANRRDMITLGLFATIASNMKSYSVNYKLRKQGLVYGVEFAASESIESHGFDLCVTASNQKFSEVYAYTVAAIRDLAKNGITDKEFKQARRELAESYEDGTASSDSIIGWYLRDYLMDGVLLTPSDFAKTTQSITQEEMLKLARDVFAYDNLYHTVFSAKAIRASSSVELLAKELLVHDKPVTEKLLAQNSFSMDGEDVKYGRAIFAVLVVIFALFIIPAGTEMWQQSFSNVYLSGIGFPWNFMTPVLFGLAFITPYVMRGRELRKTMLQFISVFVAWAAILAIFKTDTFSAPLISGDILIRTQGWALLSMLGIALLVSGYGARQLIKEWLQNIRFGKLR